MKWTHFIEDNRPHRPGLPPDLATEPSFLSEGAQFVRNLNQKCAFRIGQQKNGAILCSVDDIRFEIDSREDLYILNEIFVTGCYNVLPQPRQVVFDIGMNTGMASLFFAGQSLTERVYGFEPLQPTYDLALKNFALNPLLAAKIVPARCGLGGVDRNVVIDYFPKHRGSLGIHGLNSFINADDVSEKQPLVVRNSSQLLGPPIRANSGHPLVLKVDCEGSEYEIFEDLALSGLLTEFSVVMCEWHFHGPNPINERLRQANFTLLNLRNAETPIGMIFGFKPHDSR